MAPAAAVDISGTKLLLYYSVPPTSTGRDLKRIIHKDFGLPLARQTLFITSDDGYKQVPLRDDSSLEGDHGIGDGCEVELRLEVEKNTTVPISVQLVSEQYPDWAETVICMETTTVSEFRMLVAYKVWSDGDTGGLAVEQGPDDTVMKDDGVSTLADYLVCEGTVVGVVFKNRMIGDVGGGDHEEEGEEVDEDAMDEEEEVGEDAMDVEEGEGDKVAEDATDEEEEEGEKVDEDAADEDEEESEGEKVDEDAADEDEEESEESEEEMDD